RGSALANQGLGERQIGGRVQLGCRVLEQVLPGARIAVPGGLAELAGESELALELARIVLGRGPIDRLADLLEQLLLARGPVLADARSRPGQGPDLPLLELGPALGLLDLLEIGVELEQAPARPLAGVLVAAAGGLEITLDLGEALLDAIEDR